MIALTIDETRPFMAALLMNDTFDHLLLREASLTTFCTYTIDGTYQSRFSEEASESETTASSRTWTPWALLRPQVFNLIKGKRTPLAMRFVFQLSPDDTKTLFEKAGLPQAADAVYGLYLNLKYENNKVLVTTGSAQKGFPPSTTVDQIWDTDVRHFFREKEISVADL